MSTFHGTGASKHRLAARLSIHYIAERKLLTNLYQSLSAPHFFLNFVFPAGLRDVPERDCLARRKSDITTPNGNNGIVDLHYIQVINLKESIPHHNCSLREGPQHALTSFRRIVDEVKLQGTKKDSSPAIDLGIPPTSPSQRKLSASLKSYSSATNVVQ